MSNCWKSHAAAHVEYKLSLVDAIKTQYRLLNHKSPSVEHMIVINSDNIHQHGILISLRSTRAVHTTVKQSTQDKFLENMFRANKII